MNKVLQILGLSLLVVILPAVSWYFLKSGLDYRMESMDKLGEYGQLPDMELGLSNGNSVKTSYLQGKMAIVHEIDADTSLIMKFYRQFSKRSDLQFILSDNKDLRLKADRVANLWLLDDSSKQQLFKAIGLEKAVEKNVALIDINGDIRNYYNLDESDELKQMVEHTAFLLPVEETAKPMMKREAEK